MPPDIANRIPADPFGAAEGSIASDSFGSSLMDNDPLKYMSE